MRSIAVRPTRKILFLLIGALAVVLGISGLLCAKQYGQMSQVGQEINGRRAELAKRKGLARDLNSAMAELQKSRAKVRHLERRVSDKDYMPTLLGQLEELALSCDLRIAVFEPQAKKVTAAVVEQPIEGVKGSNKPGSAPGAPPPKPAAPAAAPGGIKGDVDVTKVQAASAPDKGPYDFQTIDVTVSGTYWNVVKFITKMTEFPKILAVSSVKVEQKKAGIVGTSPVLSVKIEFDAYMLDSKKPQPTASTISPAQPGAAPSKS